MYWCVDDGDAPLTALTGAGAMIEDAVRDVGGGRRIATVADRDGNAIGSSGTAEPGAHR